MPLYVRLALAKRKDPLPAVKGKGLRDRKSTPDRFWLLAEVGRGEPEVQQSSCVEGEGCGLGPGDVEGSGTTQGC